MLFIVLFICLFLIVVSIGDIITETFKFISVLENANEVVDEVETPDNEEQTNDNDEETEVE